MTKAKAKDGTNRGRNTNLTPAVAEKIVTAVRSGAPLEVAAQAVGIPPGTFWEWMARGESRDPDRGNSPVYADFAEKVRRAEAEVHILTIGTIRNAAINRGSWEAARAWLRMRWPKHYAERTEVSGPEGGAVPLEIAGILEGMTDDDLDRLADRLSAALAPGGREGPTPEG
jgi:hypothetical protein